MLKKKEWVELIEDSGLHYNPNLSRMFENTRIKELVTLYISLHQNFQFMHRNLSFPKHMTPLVTRIVASKRKIFPLNFSLIFNKKLTKQ